MKNIVFLILIFFTLYRIYNRYFGRSVGEKRGEQAANGKSIIYKSKC